MSGHSPKEVENPKSKEDNSENNIVHSQLKELPTANSKLSRRDS
jgi:hypothetical protein